MRRLIVGLLIIFVINSQVYTQTPFSLGNIWTLLKWSDELFIKGITYKASVDLIADSTGDEFAKVIAEVEKVSLQLETFSTKINQKLDSIINTLVHDLRDNIILQFGKTQLHNLFNTIDRLHSQAVKLKIRGRFGNIILENFFKLTLWSSNSVPSILEQIYQSILPLKHYIIPPLIELMIEDAQYNLEYDCNKYMSAQQQMYYIFNRIILAEMKGLSILTYAYSTQQILDDSYNYTIELCDAKRIFRSRIQDYYTHLTKALSLFPRDVHRCDVDPSRVGVDFIELYRFSRANIFSMYNLTSALKINRARTGNCRLRCDEINESTLGYDAKTSGTTIYNCQYLGGRVKACPYQKSLHREYLWWKNQKGTYGHYKPCDNEEDLSGFIEDTSYLGIPTDLKRCDTCVCSVDMNAIEKPIVGEPFLTSISISPQMSNISNNMIVTGVKFSVYINAIHITIQENKFSSGGIAVGNSSWKELVDRNVTINNNYFDKFEFANFDHDWKTLDLDDIMMPDNYVVTGVKFGRENQTSSFRLEVHGTPFDFNTGLLNPNGSKWFTYNNDSSETDSIFNNRKQIEMIAPDDSTRCLYYDYDRETHKSIKFSHTDIRKDAGRHTVPYFDTQPVDTQPSFPLTGIGLFYRGKEGFGGYIAPRIFTIDVHTQIKSTLNHTTNSS
ncbi:hypothetical protein PV326_006451, partial [Microctonus aethiopoides]